MIETGAESRLDIQLRKQFLNDHQPGEGRKPLILETKLGNFVDTSENLCFTRFHYQWPPALVDFASRNVNLTNQEAVLREVSHSFSAYFMQLQGKLRKENNEDWFRQYMSGLSNPHHISFEIGKGKEINSKRIVFPVTLYEYYTGEPKAFQYKSKIEIIKEGDSWRVNVLPKSSDTEE